MRSFSRWALVLGTAALLAACQTMAPIENVSNVSVSTRTNKSLTEVQVRDAIARGGAGLGWIMKDAGPGKMHGVLLIRTHTAEVDIAYSTSTYSITYSSSVNLQEGAGKIHRQYNIWIRSLTQGINNQLAAS